MAMALAETEWQAVSDHFRCFDPSGTGMIPRATLTRILEALGIVAVPQLLDQWLLKDLLGDFAEDDVSYLEFLEWISGEPKESKQPSTSAKQDTSMTVSTSGSDDLSCGTSREIREAADALVGIASRLSSSDPTIAADIMRQVSCIIQALGGNGTALASRPSSALSTASSSKRLRRSNTHNFRDEAAELVQETGCQGEFISDLQEVSVSDLSHPSALSIWRPCRGLRLYKSEIVKKALRLICSAPVPGLNGANYLDVFRALTNSGWEHHVFLFGGLVRDILRRKVGNDIDITFTAPAAELAEICQKSRYTCQLEGDYILIGTSAGDEYLEGMVITHNGITGPENSDFSMNWVFYDFRNDVIIDKTGCAVPAIRANRCEIPCAREKWDTWIGNSGSRLSFRYYKFLSRGYEYDRQEMAYIAAKLLYFWTEDRDATVANGKEVLAALLTSQDVGKIEILRQLVFMSFSAAHESQWSPGPDCVFQSAHNWWQIGWLQQLLE